MRNPGAFVAAFAALLFVLQEPALANKFETISGGVNGPLHIKRAWLVSFFYAVGALALLGSVLAIVVPHNNALFLNYGNWKTSAVILLLIASGCFATALLL